jgi:20S proteasome alpha/beta subunit
VEGLSLDDAIRLGIEAVDAASGGKVTPATVKVAVIPSESRVFKRLSEEEVANFM